MKFITPYLWKIFEQFLERKSREKRHELNRFNTTTTEKIAALE